MKNKIVNFVGLFLLIVFVQNVLPQEKTVKVQFGVLDEIGNSVSDLKASDIQILQGKKTLPLKSIEPKTEDSLEVTIMIDSSASQEKMLPFEKKFAESIIDNILIKGKDKVAVIKFSGETSVAQDLTGNFSQAKTQLKAIEFEPPAGYIGGGVIAGQSPPNSKQAVKGSTSIWNSVENVTNAFAKMKNNDSRQVIILISDGVNTYGDGKLKEAVFSSVKNRIPIYAVGIGDSLYDGVDKETLKKLTEQTSGLLILPNSKGKDIAEQINILRNGLRSIYEATLTTNQDAPTDSLQEIKIEIINPELRKKKLQIIQPRGFVLSDK